MHQTFNLSKQKNATFSAHFALWLKNKSHIVKIKRSIYGGLKV